MKYLPNLIHCYFTQAPQLTRELMWRHVCAEEGWICAHPHGMYVYILAERAAAILLLDSEIQRCPDRDYLL
jgi:hypothetical protein